MKKYTFMFVIAMVAMIVAPAFAQSQEPFVDLDPNHWAYEAVMQLQAAGIIDGYPDQTFGGKRMLTRYEFASALAKVLPLIDPANLPTKEQVEALEAKINGLPSDVASISALNGYATTDSLEKFITKAEAGKFALRSDVDKFVTKADMDRIAKLVNEFQDELKNLGVDVAAAKRDIAALDTRIAALEAEVARVKITGSLTTFAVTKKNNFGTTAYTRDDEAISNGTNLLSDIVVVRDFDLNIKGRVNDTTTAVATINYGNYLDYVGYVDNPGDGDRSNPDDGFFPYYMYIDTKLGNASMATGRFPIQFTPYTLKKIDVDSYTSILKTDDGNYPVDGVKLAGNFYGVDLTMFAAKNDSNEWLDNGLTGQPSAGLGELNVLGGNAMGGLDYIDQSAGVRATFGIPFGGNMGLTYINAYDKGAANYDRAETYGADMSILLGNKYNVVASWTRSNLVQADGGVANAAVNHDRDAWDAKVATGFGKLGFAAGYKDIGVNFAAAGSWDKIGRWFNPVNVKGPYADFTYPIAGNLKLAVNGEYLTWKQTHMVNGFGAKDDKILSGQANVKYGLSKTNALTAGYEVVKYDPTTDGVASATESYLSVGWAHELGPNAGMNVGYEFINYDDGADGAGPYVGDYRGGMGVVQVGVSF